MRIHILGIAGNMTTPLALELTRLGHQVSGSDQDQIYPPISTILLKSKIPVNKVIDYQKIDLFIIGSSFKSFTKCQEEFALITKNHYPYISATEYLSQLLDKKINILVAGSYGKSTITSLLIWIFKYAKLNPSYMVGASFINHLPSLTTSTGDYSIIEADESINGLDTQAKFHYYPLTHLLLTSADWEHKESYSSQSSNKQSFIKLINRLPKNGILVYNPNSPSATEISKNYSQALPYNFNFSFNSCLVGKHNQENVMAATTMAIALGIKPKIIQSALNHYRGIKRRLEIKKIINNIIFIDDFAQSKDRIASALEAIHYQYPTHQIKVFFEPHASFLQNKNSIIGFNQAFKNASQITISKIKFSPSVSIDQRTTFQDYHLELGKKITYLPDYQQIIDYYQNNLKPQDILVHFSSGGKKGLDTLNRIISTFTKI
ncbi:MAG TPA: Mur ligase family protein [Candidatus Woesebacteria bacterium]|nr:Mur ligase family protein [Candidatus Woesebacteria bacterium]